MFTLFYQPVELSERRLLTSNFPIVGVSDPVAFSELFLLRYSLFVWLRGILLRLKLVQVLFVLSQRDEVLKSKGAAGLDAAVFECLVHHQF